MSKRFALVVLLSALLIVSGERSTEAQRQPLLIATVRSLDGLFSDMNYLADAAGAGQLGQILTMTTQQYVRGLDGQRPIVIYVDAGVGNDDDRSSASDFRWLVFLPTQDLRTFLQAASAQLGTTQPLPGGILRTTGARTLYLRQDGPWTLVGDSVEALQPPAMPLEKMVRATDRKADISIRGFVANMPAHLRHKTLDQLHRKARAEVAEIDMDGPTAELRALIAREKSAQIQQLVSDADEFSVGLNTDSQERQMTLSVNLTARADTLTYQRLGQFQLRPSAFAGILESSAIVSCNAIGQLPPEDATRFERLLGTIQAAATHEIRRSRRFSDEGTKQLTLRLVQALLETCQQSVQEGFFDGAGMVFYAGNDLSAVAGMRVADTRSLHDAAVALASRESAAGISWQAQMNVANHQNVALHRFSFATPNDPALRRAVGPSIEITVGLGPQEVYLAWGKQGLLLSQRAIDVVRRGSGEPVLPFHTRVSLTPLLRFYHQSSGDPNVTRLLQAMASRPGAGDAAVATATPIRNGVRLDVKVDETVLRTAGYYALFASQPQGKSSANGGQNTSREPPRTGGKR